jgi:hypothetical protein
LKELKATCLFTDEDMVSLRLSYDVLKEQAEDLVTMWRGIIAQHVHLASYGRDRGTGEPDKEYAAAVGKRYAQWVLDTARAEYDQHWLDYQYESACAITGRRRTSPITQTLRPTSVSAT